MYAHSEARYQTIRIESFQNTFLTLQNGLYKLYFTHGTIPISYSVHKILFCTELSKQYIRRNIPVTVQTCLLGCTAV
jgi:hypothetical protein